MPRWKMALRVLLFPLAVAAVVFTAAGTLNLPMVWATLALLTAFMVGGVFFFDKDLFQERLRPGPGGKDYLHICLALPLLLAHLILTGLDVGRFHWSLVPFGVQVLGLVGYAFGLGVVFWAMKINRFYSSVIRIQRERGHHPITDGPYRFVRHPGYTATIWCYVCGGLALGSFVGTLPNVLTAFLFIWRTLKEDRILQSELEGYADYARQVRYRLVPGLW